VAPRSIDPAYPAGGDSHSDPSRRESWRDTVSSRREDERDTVPRLPAIGRAFGSPRPYDPENPPRFGEWVRWRPVAAPRRRFRWPVVFAAMLLVAAVVLAFAFLASHGPEHPPVGPTRPRVKEGNASGPQADTTKAKPKPVTFCPVP
jgi:hypothetical protein